MKIDASKSFSQNFYGHLVNTLPKRKEVVETSDRVAISNISYINNRYGEKYVQIESKKP